MEHSFQVRPISVLGKLARVVRDEVTAEERARLAEELEIADARHDEFWACLADLNAVTEEDGRFRVVLPTLPLGLWKESLSLLEEIGADIDETVADAVDDLRKRAARCSFADCYFSDSVAACFAYLEGLVKQAIGEREWIALPEEADFSWGALIVA